VVIAAHALMRAPSKPSASTKDDLVRNYFRRSGTSGLVGIMLFLSGTGYLAYGNAGVRIGKLF
jgi:hypothetical protein